ncbi:hypothetical protein J7M07_01505 [bacterium]|nr:hypothetical protein [bacterium]
MKVKLFSGILLVIVLLSSSVSATPTAGFYGINPISTFLNGFAIRTIERFCVGGRGANVDSWEEAGTLLGGDADDYANGKMPDQNKDKITGVLSNYNGLTPDLNCRSEAKFYQY